MTETTQVYDTLIIGGGPAGLSAALHLSFHKRKIIIIDRHTSPMMFHTNPVSNYLGVKPLIKGRDILQKMTTEVTQNGVTIKTANVVDIKGEFPKFEVHVESKTKTKQKTVLYAKTLVFATGIARKHPRLKGDWRKWLPYAAKNEISYYCPDCESPLTQDKDILIVNSGNVRDPIDIANNIKPFAKRIRIFMTEDSYAPFTDQNLELLDESGYEWTSGLIDEIIVGKPGEQHQLITSTGEVFRCDHFFVSWIDEPRSELAKKIGVELDWAGNIITDHRGKTRIEGVWAAGDVRAITQSVGYAVGTGNYAGIMIAQFLQA